MPFILELTRKTKKQKQKFYFFFFFFLCSYCTTLCLQWEPEIIAIAVLYLACKLSKFEITDWTTKKENSKQKWWEQFVEGLTKDIIEGLFLNLVSLSFLFCFLFLFLVFVTLNY